MAAHGASTQGNRAVLTNRPFYMEISMLKRWIIRWLGLDARYQRVPENRKPISEILKEIEESVEESFTPANRSAL